ncbi:MAG: helix-turn-helix domain-containing protein [Burkholderiaceae bacterium]
MTAFAGFVDALRLAADEGDRSRQQRCQWDLLGPVGSTVSSSCGAAVEFTAQPTDPQRYDFIVVVGGLLHGGQKVPARTIGFLRDAAAAGVKLVGLCTGSFVLARAGLLEGHVACVSWFHREEFEREFPGQRVVSNQMFVVDRDRLTCAGGTSVVHLAAWIIERYVDRASAVKALRIMIEEQPLPSRTLQPEAVVSVRSQDRAVHRAMLAIEQDLARSVDFDALAEQLGLSRRQLERRFSKDIGLSPAAYRHALKLERARWMLANTDLEVTAIAIEAGFGDGTILGRALRQAEGMSPSAFRAARRPR